MEITEKVAYLKGLAEGMELDTEKKEGKLLAAIIDVLDDMALEIEDLKDAQEELGDGLDAVSDDLEDVEDVVFGEDDEDDFDDEYEYDDLDEDEEINVEAWDVQQLKKLIYAGKMTDGKTIAGIMAYAEKYCR